MAGAATCKIMLNLVIRLQRLPNFRWLTSDEKISRKKNFGSNENIFKYSAFSDSIVFFSATAIAQRTTNYKKIFNNGILAAVTHT